MTRALAIAAWSTLWFAASCAPRAVVVEAHRGAGITSEASVQRAPEAPPENTLPAFRAGLDAGADVLEMDAHLLSDGVLAVLHDDTLDRTTDAKGCISARKSPELQTVDAGARTSFRGRGVRVPTLDEVLSALPARLNVELKREASGACHRPSASELAMAAIQTLDRASARKRVLVSSFDRDVLTELHARAPDVSLALLSTSRVTSDEARTLGISAVQLHIEAIDRPQVNMLHAASIEVHAWTVDDPALALHLVDLGVDRIITDDPRTMRALLSRRTRVPPGIGRALVGCAVLLVIAFLSQRRSRPAATG